MLLLNHLQIHHINLNEFVLDHVMYKMIRKFADKIGFVKYNDRHVQNTIYWFMRFNQTCKTELVDNILHNYVYLHDKTFILDYTDFGKIKKMSQLKPTDKEKPESSATHEILSSLQYDLTKSIKDSAISKYELDIISFLMRKLNVNHKKSNIEEFLTYDEILVYLKNNHSLLYYGYDQKFDYMNLFNKCRLLFTVDDPILNSNKLFNNPSQMTHFTWPYNLSVEEKLKEIPNLREQILSYHDQSTDVETYQYIGNEYNIPHIIDIFYNDVYETASLVSSISALTLAKILKTSDKEPVKFVPYLINKKLAKYPISPTSCS